MNLIIYRFNRQVYRFNRFLGNVGYKIHLAFMKVSIPPTVIIGRGTKLAYGGIGLVINKGTMIGRNCVIGTNVTLGGRTKAKPGRINIGNNVFVGNGSIILGNVNIGDNSIIGPGSIVLDDIPPYGVVYPQKSSLRKVLNENENHLNIL